MSKIEVPAIISGSAVMIRVKQEDLYRAVEAAYGHKEVEPASLRIGPPDAAEPAKDDWVRIKGTEKTGEVTVVDRHNTGEVRRVTVRVPHDHLDGSGETLSSIFVVPGELVEVVDHPDVDKAAEAMGMAGGSFAARRRLVREVMKVVAPNHPALRG